MVSLFKKTGRAVACILELVWCIALLGADHSSLCCETPVTMCLSEGVKQLCGRMSLCNIRCSHKQPLNGDNGPADKKESSLCCPLH